MVVTGRRLQTAANILIRGKTDYAICRWQCIQRLIDRVIYLEDCTVNVDVVIM